MDLYIDERIIFPNLRVKEQDDLFNQMGSALINQELVADNFIVDLTRREAEYPTGLPTKIPISLCHADPKLVRKSFITLATLEEPIPFREMGNSHHSLAVKIAFFLGIIEGKDHINVLRELMKIVRSEDILNEIYHSKSKDKIKHILSEKLFESIAQQKR